MVRHAKPGPFFVAFADSGADDKVFKFSNDFANNQLTFAYDGADGAAEFVKICYNAGL